MSQNTTRRKLEFPKGVGFNPTVTASNGQRGTLAGNRRRGNGQQQFSSVTRYAPGTSFDGAPKQNLWIPKRDQQMQRANAIIERRNFPLGPRASRNASAQYAANAANMMHAFNKMRIEGGARRTKKARKVKA